MVRNGFLNKLQMATKVAIVLGVISTPLILWGIYAQFRIDVPSAHIAVLTRKTGSDLQNEQLVAPDDHHKGLQLNVLTEGRYYVNPWTWDWQVYPMVEIPAGKLGVRVRLYGDDLGYGEYLANKETQKGIVADVLRPGRYPINAVIKGQEGERKEQDYVEIVELYDPVTIPAGFKGVVTNLAGPLPEDPNKILVPKGVRGVQEETLDPGTYYLNPYAFRVNTIDCRSQRFNLAENDDMGFPSKDGFWVRLDGIVEFRVKPEKAAEVYVVYNEMGNDRPGESTIHEEIVKKIVLPNARSFCRLRGSNSSGREFIGGETRTAMQKDFQTAMHKACDVEGIEVMQALITKIVPPSAIAKPVRDREVAKQQMAQYKEQEKQQVAEAKLANEKAMIEQKKKLVGAEQQVVKITTTAKQRQKVAVTLAEQKLGVAQRRLEAAKDLAAAITAKKQAEAGVIAFQNSAEAAGWQKAIEALGGDGDAFARYVLLQKLAPSYRSIMSNSADSPLMDVFRSYNPKNVSIKPSVGH